MRDLETIRNRPLSAAETGHVVFGTLHTNSAPQGTVNRIIDVFPVKEQQDQIRTQLVDRAHRGACRRRCCPEEARRGWSPATN